MAEHGTHARYLSPCRCDPCRAANSEYMKSYRLRRRGQVTASSARTTRQRAIDDYGTWTREQYLADTRTG